MTSDKGQAKRTAGSWWGAFLVSTALMLSCVALILMRVMPAAAAFIAGLLYGWLWIIIVQEDPREG